MKWLKMVIISISILVLICLGGLVVYDVAYSQGEAAGYSNGYNKGYTVGQEEGYNSGNADGYQAGKQEGYGEGYRRLISKQRTLTLPRGDASC